MLDLDESTQATKKVHEVIIKTNESSIRIGEASSVIASITEQSSKSTMEIDNIVVELQNNSQNAVKTMERVAAISKEQSLGVFNNKEKYNLIEDAMN
jgi:methyl-accepting chemotaxis protein